MLDPRCYSVLVDCETFRTMCWPLFVRILSRIRCNARIMIRIRWSAGSLRIVSAALLITLQSFKEICRPCSTVVWCFRTSSSIYSDSSVIVGGLRFDDVRPHRFTAWWRAAVRSFSLNASCALRSFVTKITWPNLVLVVRLQDWTWPLRKLWIDVLRTNPIFLRETGLA